MFLRKLRSCTLLLAAILVGAAVLPSKSSAQMPTVADCTDRENGTDSDVLECLKALLGQLVVANNKLAGVEARISANSRAVRNVQKSIELISLNQVFNYYVEAGAAIAPRCPFNTTRIGGVAVIWTPGGGPRRTYVLTCRGSP